MSEAGKPSAEPISLADLIALNEEIAAMVRAGVPLEAGLGLSGGLPRNLRAVTERMRAEMEQGASLLQALRSCGAQLPPSYLALVQAGLKSNRLSDALVSAAAFARTLMEMQHQVRSALIYPLLIVGVAYGFLLVLMCDLMPRVSDMLRDSRLRPDRLFDVLTFLTNSARFWGPAAPALMILVAIWTGIIPIPFANRPAVALRRMRWLPGIHRVMDDVQSGSFCQMLGILVEREIPLPDAIELSSSASADNELARECREVAIRLRAGTPLSEALRPARRLSSFTRWMLVAGQAQGAIPSVMATLGDIFRRRARSRSEMFRMSAPLILTVILGGGAVIGYAFLLFIPMRNLFIDLSGPLGP